MRIAAHVLAYNVNRFINPMLENLSPHVDRIYLAYPSRPFGYIRSSRDSKSNPTSLAHINFEKFGDQVKVIEGDWLTEEDTRNDCLQMAKDEGFDWLVIQDADEFYPDSQWEQLRRALLRYKGEELLVTTWYNFWKSSSYVLLERDGFSLKGTNAGFALRCVDSLNFIKQRKANNNSRRIVDAPCFHYGYVQSDAEMLEKVKTWSHAGQFDADKWFQLKWLNWSLNTKNLNPVYPRSWRRAVRFPLVQPDFAEEFNLDSVFLREGPSLYSRLQDSLYDFKAATIDIARYCKSYCR